MKEDRPAAVIDKAGEPPGYVASGEADVSHMALYA
jgi:hypothetical protein